MSGDRVDQEQPAAALVGLGPPPLHGPVVARVMHFLTVVRRAGLGFHRWTVSPLRYFGSEVGLERERMDMSRAELGKIACCSYSLVAKIEVGERVPTLDFARACDATFPHANGRFERFWPLALRYAFPPWFRPYAELEWKATVVRTSQPILIPSMERQHVLTREHEPVRLWIVVRESVLTSTVGGPEVMREQPAHLRKLAEQVTGSSPPTARAMAATASNGPRLR